MVVLAQKEEEVGESKQQAGEVRLLQIVTSK
jgi:hypothetical protein